MPRPILILFFTTFLSVAPFASAKVLTWQLETVNFDEGSFGGTPNLEGTATGFFEFDVDRPSNQLVDWDIHTNFPQLHATYFFNYAPGVDCFEMICAGGSSTALNFQARSFSADSATLTLAFAVPLSDMGGRIDLVLNGVSHEEGGLECGPGMICPYSRAIIGGAIVAVPEPSAVASLVIGLFGMAWSRSGWRTVSRRRA